jgi:prevent-host-death family protein
MRTVNIHEAKTTLSKLIEAVEAGENVVLARAGRPIARIVRYEKRGGVRLGVLKGKIPADVMEAVEKPLSKRDIARLFGSGIEP